MVSLLRVYSLVDAEAGALAEGLPTLIAFKRLLPGVHSLMDAEAGALTEGLPTSIAFIWFLSSVNSPVFSEM